jgi:hypothetical protein
MATDSTLQAQFIRVLSDGSSVLLLVHTARGDRQLVVSGRPAAPTFTLDGALLGDLDPALVAFGTHLLEFLELRDQLLADPGVQALFNQ